MINCIEIRSNYSNANPTHIRKKSNLRHTRGITSKRVTNSGVYFHGLPLNNTASKKRRCGGEQLMTLRPI